MKKEIGLYISTDGKNIYRTVVSMTGKTVLPPTTVAEEIIGISELELGDYIKTLDSMLEAYYPKRSLFTTFDDIYGDFCTVLEGLENFNILYGTLIRMEVFKDMPADDHSEEYYRKAKKNILYGLSELTGVNYIVNDILKNLSSDVQQSTVVYYYLFISFSLMAKITSK